MKVSDGKLTDVKMTVAGIGAGRAGVDIRGRRQLEAEGAAGARDEVPDLGDRQGRRADVRPTANSIFTTVSSANSFIGTYTPDDGTTVGVGMPVSFNFDKAITDKKAVQSHITGHAPTAARRWSGTGSATQRLDFRPEEYWKAGSKVTMKIDLDGVEGANGVYGVQKKTVTFTVGRSQVSTVDVNTQTMTVVRDGKTLKTIPISAGSPEHTTYNGQMVISEKFMQTRMNSQTVGLGGEYDIPDVPHAMRLTSSGTFIHGNYWYSKGNPPFGSQGTSHGCVGLAGRAGRAGRTRPPSGSTTTRSSGTS